MMNFNPNLDLDFDNDYDMFSIFRFVSVISNYNLFVELGS
jgi:hypothetical protein